MVYLNWRGPQGRETVDQISLADFATTGDFKRELRRLISEYAIAGMEVYRSCRACANWR